jgi:Tfp pilus assembly protein PilO
MKKLAAAIERFSRDAALNMTFVGMTIVLILLAWLGIGYLQKNLNQLERDITKRQAMLERGAQFQASSSRLKQQLTAIESTLEDLQAKLPNTPEETQFLHELSECATATGVSLSDFRPGGVTQRPNCKDMDLRLRGTGPYASVCVWVSRLRDLPRLVRISHVTITGPATPGGDCLIDLQLSLVFGVTAQAPLASTVKP